MTIPEIRNILESPYNRKVWKTFIQTQFTNNKLYGNEQVLSLADKTLSKQCLTLGNYEVDEYTKIGIFEVELNEKVNITRNRVALRNLIKDITKQVSGAMVVFVQGDKWRFSYISKRKIKNKDTNEIVDKETTPKRYTYLFGKNEKALTASIRFDRLIQKQKENIFQFLTLNDFEEAFSVEKLSKEFFKNYKDTYEDFVQFLTGKRYGKKGKKYEEQVMHEPNWQLTSLFSNDEKQARDFCKRMMGRIVFLYFIQKKGWLAVGQNKNWGEGNPDYMFDLFNKSKHQADFYHEELVPLFFKTLNNPDSENAKHAFRFPYLNGGLFDDSHDKKYNNLHLPETVFKNLFETFNNFNFTVYEDAPDEHTVAVDPEMLGHIFENLLEDNKDKGAFYTPKEIVHYMCKESLNAYLLANDDLQFAENETAKKTIEHIIQQQELSSDEKQYAEKNAYKIIDALEKVKICDPAIGSGAFPMGLLQEIFNAQIYLQELKGFKKGITDAQIKKHIIEESIYGVDIDAGAVDIARLRFWLSLVVDEQVPQPLPNLDFKIVCANTLIPTGYDQFVELAELTKAPTLLRMDGEIQKLQSIRDRYFDESDKKLKDDLKKEFVTTRNYIISEFESLKKSYKLGDFLEKINEWQPFEETSCSWFDAWWMFGIKDGFDIVIGNPPYDVYEGHKKEEIETINKIPIYEIAKGGKLNAYKLFLARTSRFLKANGILCQIFQNSFLADNSATKLRKHFLENQQILKIDSFPERDNLSKRVFESAKMSVCILFSKNKKVDYYEYDLYVWEDRFRTKGKNVSFSNMETLTFDSNNFTILSIIEGEKSILNELKQFKILSDFGFCFQGEINLTVHKELLHKTSEGNSPMIKGAAIQKWHLKEKMSQGEIEYLDSVAYLKDNKGKRSQHHKARRVVTQGITGVDERNRIKATILHSGIFCAHSVNYIILNKGDLEYEYLLALLNSDILNWYFKIFSTNSNVNGYEVNSLPVTVVAKHRIAVKSIVEYLLVLNNEKTKPLTTQIDNDRISSHLEEVLNMMVYELYFEKHMKENGIDVLQFINPKPIADFKDTAAKAEVIKDFYLWYQKPENPVRQRMLLVETRSKDKIALINKSIQQ